MISVVELKNQEIEVALKINYMVFNGEQGIPKKIIPVSSTLTPKWYGLYINNVLAGTAAFWSENNQWHWGRYAILDEYRGRGLGKVLFYFSFKLFYQSNLVDEVFIEARESAMNIALKYGAKVIGKKKVFYGIVIPMKLNRGDFNKIAELPEYKD